MLILAQNYGVWSDLRRVSFYSRGPFSVCRVLSGEAAKLRCAACLHQMLSMNKQTDWDKHQAARWDADG